MKLIAELLQFRRRRAVEHVALGAVDKIEAVGFNRQRPALARQFGDLLDTCEGLIEEGCRQAQLIDIKQMPASSSGSGSGMLTQRMRCVCCTTQVPFGR